MVLDSGVNQLGLATIIFFNYVIGLSTSFPISTELAGAAAIRLWLTVGFLLLERRERTA